MRTPRIVIVTAAAVVAVGLLYFVVLPDTEVASPHLKVVRHAVESGSEVVFFRVELPDSRRVQICSVEKVIGGKVEEPWVSGSGKPLQLRQNFWAPSQGWPMGDPGKGRKEFGVLAPTNATVWKLRVTVSLSMPRSWMLWQTMLECIKQRRLLSKATSGTWNTFYQAGTETVESETITNAVPRL